MWGLLQTLDVETRLLEANYKREREVARRERERFAALSPYEQEHERQVAAYEAQFKALHAPRVSCTCSSSRYSPSYRASDDGVLPFAAGFGLGLLMD